MWIIRRKQHGKTQIISLSPGFEEARVRAVEYQLKAHISGATVVDLAQKYIDEIAVREFRRPELAQGYLDQAILPAIGHRKVPRISGHGCRLALYCRRVNDERNCVDSI